MGVLLARYHFYDDAIQHFQAALQANPNSDEVKFDLADAYFRKRHYAAGTRCRRADFGRRPERQCLSGFARRYLRASWAIPLVPRRFTQNAISRNPDNDQDYLSLALLQFRETNDRRRRKQTLLQGQARIPASGKILWGLGIASALEGNTAEAAQQFERAVDMLPNGREAIRLSAFSTFRPDRSPRRRKC